MPSYTIIRVFAFRISSGKKFTNWSCQHTDFYQNKMCRHFLGYKVNYYEYNCMSNGQWFVAHMQSINQNCESCSIVPCNTIRIHRGLRLKKSEFTRQIYYQQRLQYNQHVDLFTFKQIKIKIRKNWDHRQLYDCTFQMYD